MAVLHYCTSGVQSDVVNARERNRLHSWIQLEPNCHLALSLHAENCYTDGTHL